MGKSHDLSKKFQREWKKSCGTFWNQMGTFMLYVLKFTFICFFGSQWSIIVGLDHIEIKLLEFSSRSLGFQWLIVRIECQNMESQKLVIDCWPFNGWLLAFAPLESTGSVVLLIDAILTPYFHLCHLSKCLHFSLIYILLSIYLRNKYK